MISHERLRQDLAGIELAEGMHGDNLAITLVSAFEDGSEEWGDDGWEPHAIAKAKKILDAIHAYYAPHLVVVIDKNKDPT